MRIGLLITARCNASCLHCTVNSGPRQTAELATEQVVGIMDAAADLWRRERLPGEPLQFAISGGEPFLDFERLIAVVAHGRKLGADVTCVTNGYWAVSDEKARSRLAVLKRAGLTMLGVSTSRFHERYVKRERVQRVLDLAREAGLPTGLKCVTTASEGGRTGSRQRWARAQMVDHLEVFPVLPYLRSGAELPESEFVRTRRLPGGTCPAPSITIREDGTAYTCCMPGGFTEFLALGNVFDEGLAEIHDRFYLRGVQQVLRDRGPVHFARAIIAAGQGRRLRDRYESVCDLCAHIAGDPAMSALARRTASIHERRQLRAEIAKLGRGRRRAAPARGQHLQGRRHGNDQGETDQDRGR